MRIFTSVATAILLSLRVVAQENPTQEPAAPKAPSLQELVKTLANAALSAEDKARLPRQILLQALEEKAPDTAIRSLSDFITRECKAPSNMPAETRLAILATAADAVRCLQLFSNQGMQKEVREWLFWTPGRMALVADTVAPEDNLFNAIETLDTLYTHDPKGREQFFSLILALALVWDQERPPMHNQMGKQPKYSADIPARYGYFRRLYSSPKGQTLYADLDVQSLFFVVDTPVPVKELAWALDNVHGSRNNWKNQYANITYDRRRERTGTFDWPFGAYTLESIEEHGGICVDQAYFATLTARAHGIPAVAFTGMGKGAGHAWFAYQKDPTEWELDIGRYRDQDLDTGHAIHPQTCKEFTDHDLALTCEFTRRTKEFRKARAYTRVAEILLENKELTLARQCALAACTLAPLFEKPWDIRVQTLLDQKRKAEAAECLALKAEAFRQFPDVVTHAVEEQASLLKSMGRKEEAQRILDRQMGKVENRRQDLAQDMVVKQANETAEQDPREARKKMEGLLKDQIREGLKTVPLIDEYLALTKKTYQTKEAKDFLESYIQRLLQKNDKDPAVAVPLLQQLRQAYANDNDEKGLRRVEREIERRDLRKRDSPKRGEGNKEDRKQRRPEGPPANE